MNRAISALSCEGEYLAYSSPDGCLKIWETSSGTLKQEYTPSSHLSATCSSLRWRPNRAKQHASKKSKKEPREGISSLQLVAMGTLTGEVLLYSFTNARLHSSLANGHSSAVTDVAWLPRSTSLYSCSSDMHLIVWDIASGTVKSKLKADKVAIHSICILDEDNILTASTIIHWWDVKQKTVIRSFKGHASEIFRLLPVFTEGVCTHVLSAAKGERVINCWSLNKDTKRAIASFILPHEPHSLDVLPQADELLTIAVVSQDGSFHLFKHSLEKRSKEGVEARFHVQIATKGSGSKPQPVLILTASIASGLDDCLLAYGAYGRPVFERISIADTLSDVFLIRNMSNSVVTIEDSISKIRHAEKAKHVKMLAPGHMTSLPGQSHKRKQAVPSTKEMTMEECLKSLDLSKAPKDVDTADELNVKSDSMVHLLLQGLQSKDKDMLNTVFQCGNPTIIHNTLERLPLQSIFPSLRELHERLNKRELRNHSCLKWLSELLAVHLPYLMSCVDADVYLGPINELIEARVENFHKMLQLRGCLHILLSQATASAAQPYDVPLDSVIEYESESSDESENENDDSFEDLSNEQVGEEAMYDSSECSSSVDSDIAD